MAAWWENIASLFQKEKTDDAPSAKHHEYTMRHPNVKLLHYEPSGRSTFSCIYHHDFIDDYDTMKNSHWGCPECNTMKNQQFTPYIPTSPKSTRELALSWYWQRREQKAETKDEMARLCDEIERTHQALKILSYSILPSDKIQGQWVYEFTIECALDGILRVQHPAFSMDNLPDCLCPRCQKRWSGELPNSVKFPIKS